MSREDFMREEKETLFDLYFGIGIFGILLIIAGMFLIERKLSFILGVCYGAVVAVVLVSHMYHGLQITLCYDEEGARKHAQKMVGIRMWIMLAAVGLAMYFSKYLHLAGVILGILTLKVSAYIQPFVHRRITSKLYQKRRVKL